MSTPAQTAQKRKHILFCFFLASDLAFSRGKVGSFCTAAGLCPSATARGAPRPQERRSFGSSRGFIACRARKSQSRRGVKGKGGLGWLKEPACRPREFKLKSLHLENYLYIYIYLFMCACACVRAHVLYMRGYIHI